MCHYLISLLCSFYLHDIEAEYVRRSIQDLCQTWTGSSSIPRYEFFDVEAGFAKNFDNKFAVLLPYILNIEDDSFTDLVCSPMSDPFGCALVYCGAL